MSGELKTHLTHGGTWLRGLLMLLFAILYGVAEFVIGVVAVLQFGSHLITGAPMTRLLEFARGLNAYAYQILQFVTYRSEVRPFPLSAWPTQGMEDVAQAEQAEVARAVVAPEPEVHAPPTTEPGGGSMPPEEPKEKDAP